MDQQRVGLYSHVQIMAKNGNHMPSGKRSTLAAWTSQK
jgi:hypothetical protein